MSIELVGDRELRAALRRYGKFAANEIADAVDATAMNVQGDAVKSMQRGQKSGRTYQKRDPKRTHKASAAGEAPATDTGELAGSVAVVEGGMGRIGPVVFVGSDLERAEWLEFGTRNMAERPWLRPAVEKNRPLFRKRLVNAIKKTHKRITG